MVVVCSTGGKAMRLLSRIAIILLLASAGTALAFQRNRFQRFDPEGPYGSIPSEQSHEKTEFGWSRLRYDSAGFNGFRGGATGQEIIPRPIASFSSPSAA